MKRLSRFFLVCLFCFSIFPNVKTAIAHASENNVRCRSIFVAQNESPRKKTRGFFTPFKSIFSLKVPGDIVALTAQKDLYQLDAEERQPAKDIPMILLGTFGAGNFQERTSDLDKSARLLSKQLHHPVITYLDFPKAGYVDPKRPFDDFKFEDTVRYALFAAVKKSPDAKPIFVQLDGIDPKKINETYQWPGIYMATNAEIRNLLAEPGLFFKTRWLLNGREISQNEAVDFLAPYLESRKRQQKDLVAAWEANYQAGKFDETTFLKAASRVESELRALESIIALRVSGVSASEH